MENPQRQEVEQLIARGPGREWEARVYWAQSLSEEIEHIWILVVVMAAENLTTNWPICWNVVEMVKFVICNLLHQCFILIAGCL